MLWPLYARHLVPDGGWLVQSQLTDVRLSGFMPTLFTMLVGPLGWAIHAVLLVLAVRLLDREAKALPADVVRPDPRVGAGRAEDLAI
jgi:hypothetical protein